MHCNAVQGSVQPFTQFLTGTFLEVSQQAGSAAVTVWCYLLSRANRAGKCWPSQKTMAADLGIGIRTIQRSLASLEALGFVAREAIGRRHSYHVHGRPPAKSDASTTGGQGSTTGVKMAPQQASKQRTNNTQGNHIQVGVGVEVFKPFKGNSARERLVVKKAPPSEGANTQPDSQTAPGAVRRDPGATDGKAHSQPAATQEAGGQGRRGGARRGGQLPRGVTEQDLRHVDRMAQIHRASTRMPWSLPKFFAAASYALERGDNPVALLQWMLRYDKRHWCQADEEAGRRASQIFTRRLSDGDYTDDERWAPLWREAGVAA